MGEERERADKEDGTRYPPIHPLLLLFVIKRGSSEGLPIDSREAYFCLIHCLYVGQQPCPQWK